MSDSSAASSRSGNSVALVPTNKPVVGVTAAQTGAAAATGVDAANNVSNTALSAVNVDGANQAPVSLSSDAETTVQNTGAAGANTGAAWAIGAGAVGAPSGVATPTTAGTSPTSGPVSATGLKAQTLVDSGTTTSITTTGGPTNTSPVVIAPTLVVNVTSTVGAAATSGAACTGVACPSNAPLTVAGNTATTAASGAATAQGLVAQNVVNTGADVVVKVSGQNFAPIKVVIDSVTNIFNWGGASATTGDATATGTSTTGSSTPQTAQTASGTAEATGAQIQNTVNLRSSASVTVNGDNFNPIKILLNLAANLVNKGVGLSTSGDAVSNSGASTGGSGSVSSGASSATGLQVLNLVNMWAIASVDVEGNNYAPITIEIHFNTNIDNTGYAVAASGNVAAGPTGSASALVGSPSGSQPAATTGSGATTGAGSAHGGNVVAVANSVDASITSTQMSSANGSKPIASVALTQLLRNLPSGSWSPMTNSTLPAATVAPIVAGTDSHSGDSTAVGLHSVVGQTNTQMAACSDPSGCIAGNISTISTSTQDLASNPATTDGDGNHGGPGGTNSSGGFTGINATPTPVPTRDTGSLSDDGTQQNGNSGGGGGSSSRMTHQVVNSTLAQAFAPDGQLVVVDLFDQWPGRRLPPMPNQETHRPTGSNVQAEITGWPGADELPLPVPLVDEPVGTAGAQSQGSARAPATLVRRNPSADSAAEADSDSPYPPLSLVDVNPWADAHAAEMLPMPGQSVPVAQVQAPSDRQEVLPSTPSDADGGVTSVEYGPAALLAGLVGMLDALRRTRGTWFPKLIRVLPLATRPASLRGLRVKIAAAPLHILRLMLGLLRTL